MTNPSATCQLTDTLRNATRLQHERLHELVDLSAMMAGAADYGRGLIKYWHFVAPLEAQLHRYVDTHPSLNEVWNDRLSKREWLRRDLQATGKSFDEACPAPVVAPEIVNLSDFVGCSYVLEGMTLGGQGIGKQIERQHPEWSGRATHFFRSYGSETMRNWRNWQAWANDQSIDRQQTIEMAKKTFGYFVDVWSSKTTQ